MVPDQITEMRQVQAALRKRWLFILPAVFLTYSLAYLDRANYGFGAAAGLAATLHISDARSALLGALFFLGYFLFQIPGAAYAQRNSVTRLIFLALISWGVLAALTGILRNFWLLAIDRLLLGTTESFILPAMLILLTRWFTHQERSRTNTLLFLGNPVTVLWMSTVTGYIIHAVGWQMTFVIEGVPSILWAFIWLWIVRDRPEQASWMNAEATATLNRQLEREQWVLPQVASLKSAMRHPSVSWLCIQYFLWSIAMYGYMLWLPTVIQKGASRGIEITGLLNAVPYLLAVVLMLLVAYFSDRTLRRKLFVWPFLMLSGVLLFISCFTTGASFLWTYIFLIFAGGVMYAPYGPFFAIIPEMLPGNVAGEVMALVNSCGALGGFFGAWLVGLLVSRTGNPRSAFLFMALCMLLSGLILFLLRTSANHSLIPIPESS